MPAIDFDLVTTMFDHIENQFKEASLVDSCYAIVNVLIREPNLYTLSEKDLTLWVFESRFEHIHHMARWLCEMAVLVHTRGSFGKHGDLSNKTRTHTLDTFNVDFKHTRVSGYECLQRLKEALTQLYVALVGCLSERAYYDRIFDTFIRDVYSYLENYIKVIEYEQREPKEHNQLPRQADRSDDQLSGSVVSGGDV